MKILAKHPKEIKRFIYYCILMPLVDKDSDTQEYLHYNIFQNARIEIDTQTVDYCGARHNYERELAYRDRIFRVYIKSGYDEIQILSYDRKKHSVTINKNSLMRAKLGILVGYLVDVFSHTSFINSVEIGEYYG